MRRILVYRLGSLGDTIVALPCLHAVRDRFPNAERTLLTNHPVSPSAPRMADILAGSGLIDDTIAYDMGTRSPLPLLALWSRLRRLRADALVYLAGPRGSTALRRDLAFFRFCGIPRIIGAPTSPELFHNRIDAAGEEEYECARLARCLEGELGPLDLDDRRNWSLGTTPAEAIAADKALAILKGEPFVAVNMGGKALYNDWGHDNWTVLLPRLAARFPAMRLVFFGAQSDTARADDILRLLPGRVLNLCGALSIRGTAAALGRASLFVGHDSGPLHLASSAGVPCVGIFSSQNKRHKWFPYGRRHSILYPAGPISTITVEEVFAAVAAAFDALPTPSRRAGHPA